MTEKKTTETFDEKIARLGFTVDESDGESTVVFLSSKGVEASKQFAQPKPKPKPRV